MPTMVEGHADISSDGSFLNMIQELLNHIDTSNNESYNIAECLGISEKGNV